MTSTSKILIGLAAGYVVYLLLKPKKKVIPATNPTTSEEGAGGGGVGIGSPAMDTTQRVNPETTVSTGTTATSASAPATSASTATTSSATATDPLAGRPNLSTTPVEQNPFNPTKITGIEKQNTVSNQLGFSGTRRNGFVPSKIVIGNTTL